MTRKITNGIKNVNVVFAIASTLLCFSFLVYKAYITAFTHDESFTFLHFMPLSVMDIISYNPPVLNNHILNTLLMKLCSVSFGNSEISLRLPVLISFLFFSYYVFLILRSIHPFLFIASYVVVVSNPFLLDFFCLARGYGIAIAFMAASIFYYLTYNLTNKTTNLGISLVFAFLSALSNLGLIHYVLTLICIHNIIWVIKRNDKEKHQSLPSFFSFNKPVIILLSFCFIIFYEPLRKVMKFKLVDSGGTNGFFADTVESLLVYSTKGGYGLDYTFLKYLIVVSATLHLLIWAILSYKDKYSLPTQFNYYSLLTLMLAGVIFEIILQHIFLGTQYIVNRFALFLVPLFYLALSWQINTLVQFKRIFIIISFLIASVCLYSTLFHIEKKGSVIWRYDADNKKMLVELEKRSEKKPVSLGITWLFEPSLNYYRKSQNINWLKELTRDGTDEDYDYYYVTKEDYIKLKEKKDIVLIKHFEHSDNYFVQRAN